MQPLFSVVLIAKNEAKVLPRLLDSLSEFKEQGGEVVLCDTGSTDNTAQIARDWGAKVTEVGERFITKIDGKLAAKINKQFVIKGEEPIVKSGDRLFDYAAARNFAATLASNDMVATPDCDEIYTRLDLAKINEAISNGIDQLEYNFVFSHDEFGNEAIKFAHSKFYNRTKLTWVGVVHEVLQGSATRQFVDESIIKLEHWQNPETNRSGYLKGLALDCYLHPESDRNSHYLARELMWTGRPWSAIKEFERHIAMDKWLAERAQSMVFIGDCWGMLGQPEQQFLWYSKAFYHDSGRREALIKIARFYKHNNNPQAVVCYATAALAIPYAPFYANDMAHYTHEPHALLYWAYGWLGNIEKAREHMNLALSYRPNDTTYLRDWSFYFPTPKVSIVIPTLGRPDKLARLLELIDQNANYTNYEVIVEHDSFEERQGAPKTFKKGVERSTGELVMFLGNDCVPKPNFLIHAVKQMFDSFPDMDGLVGLNDGYWHGEFATHFLASKALLPSLDGEFLCTEYHHTGCDNELTARCQKMGKYVWAEKSEVYHDHPIQNNFAETDEVYQLAYAIDSMDHDTALLHKRAKKLGFTVIENLVKPATI